MAVDRQEMAKGYRLKSDESYRAAQKDLEDQFYRSACNRSWYAVMQIITAATYEDLTEIQAPADGKPNWTHERQSSLFRFLVKKHRLDREHKGLAPEIDMMRERRNDVDYGCPKELYANLQSAKCSVEIAEKVRAVIFLIIGERWNSHELSNSTTDVQR